MTSFTGPNDMLIAAQALASECVLVTANVGEFLRVAELQIENWLTGQSQADQT